MEQTGGCDVLPLIITYANAHPTSLQWQSFHGQEEITRWKLDAIAFCALQRLPQHASSVASTPLHCSGNEELDKTRNKPVNQDETSNTGLASVLCTRVVLVYSALLFYPSSLRTTSPKKMFYRAGSGIVRLKERASVPNYTAPSWAGKHCD